MVRVDTQKITETIIYVANRLENPTISTVCKLLYFADLYHMQMYGRFVTGDKYVAMQHGPVPSCAYDKMKNYRESSELGIQNGDLEVIEGYYLKAQRDADIEEFSESDIASLDYAIEKFGSLSASQLRDKSHQGAWDRITGNGAIFQNSSSVNVVEMDLETIIEMLPNSEELRLHLERAGHL